MYNNYSLFILFCSILVTCDLDSRLPARTLFFLNKSQTHSYRSSVFIKYNSNVFIM